MGTTENVIYIVTHKQCSFPSIEGYKPIFVGNSKPESGFLRDDSGDNIAEKNAEYCELTAQYWVWKNVQYGLTGFVHYRRYFYNSSFSNNSKYIVPISQFTEDINRHGLVLPNYQYRKQTVIQEYALYHNVADLEKTRDVLKTLDPHAVHAFDEVMHSHFFAPYNMFVMSPELFSNYMEWLFSIFNILEDKVDYSNYDAYNKRIFGFISERLLNVWVKKRGS